MHAHFPFPLLLWNLTVHICPFLCREGLNNVFSTGETIFIQIVTGSCEIFIKKRRRHKPQMFCTLNSGQDKNLLLLFHFWFSQCSMAYIAAGRKLPFLKGHLTQREAQQVMGPFTKSCKEFSLFQATLSQCICGPEGYFSIYNYVFLSKSWL